MARRPVTKRDPKTNLQISKEAVKGLEMLQARTGASTPSEAVDIFLRALGNVSDLTNGIVVRDVGGQVTPVC